MDVQRCRAPEETAQEGSPADRVQPPLRAVCSLRATRTKEVVRKGSEFFLGGRGGGEQGTVRVLSPAQPWHPIG